MQGVEVLAITPILTLLFHFSFTIRHLPLWIGARLRPAVYGVRDSPGLESLISPSALITYSATDHGVASYPLTSMCPPYSPSMSTCSGTVFVLLHRISLSPSPPIPFAEDEAQSHGLRHRIRVRQIPQLYVQRNYQRNLETCPSPTATYHCPRLP